VGGLKGKKEVARFCRSGEAMIPCPTAGLIDRCQTPGQCGEC